MQRFMFIAVIIAVAALFIVPESMIGEYKGLITAKYFIKEQSIKVKNIFMSLLRGEKPEEFKDIEGDVKEAIKDTVREKIEEQASTNTNRAFEINIGIQ